MKYKFPFEILLISGMFTTLFIPSNLSSIAAWTDLSSLLFLRVALWFLGLSTLPGLLLLRIAGLEEEFSYFEKAAIIINLSLILVGLIAMIMYYFYNNINSIPWTFLVILILLVVPTYFLKPKINSSSKHSLCKLDLILIGGIITSILIALSIQISVRYLIPGDLWVCAKAAVQIISRPDLYKSWDQNYPLMFGFILASLSISSGVPIINTYVLLFPFIGLNMISFYALIKEVFRLNKKILVVACIIYGFTGGLGWIIQKVVYRGMIDFWTVSYLTQDMYFNDFFWHNIEFSYKSLALTLGYMCIFSFTVSIRLKNIFKKAFMLILSSLLILFSFFIHMIEPIILFPLTFYISYVYQRKRDCLLSVSFLMLITLLFFCVLDLLMHGYYYWLTIDKIKKVLLIQIDFDKIIFYLLLFIVLSILIVIMKQFIYSIISKRKELKIFHVAKSFIVVILIIIYLSGLYFWWNAPTYEIPIYLLNELPWYYYTTRFGLVGLFALIGLIIAGWEEKWFKIAIFWAIFVLFVGNLWWGPKITCYLFPVVALFAAIGLNSIRDHVSVSLILIITKPTNLIGKKIKINLGPIIAALVILVAASSQIYGINYYLSMGPCITDDEARMFAWIQQNTPKNIVVIVPEIYTIKLGVITIADRKIFQYQDLPPFSSTESLFQTLNLLRENNINYLVVVEHYNKFNDLIDYLISFSNLVYQSNTVKVYKIPEYFPTSK